MLYFFSYHLLDLLLPSHTWILSELHLFVREGITVLKKIVDNAIDKHYQFSNLNSKYLIPINLESITKLISSFCLHILLLSLKHSNVSNIRITNKLTFTVFCVYCEIMVRSLLCSYSITIAKSEELIFCTFKIEPKTEV